MISEYVNAHSATPDKASNKYWITDPRPANEISILPLHVYGFSALHSQATDYGRDECIKVEPQNCGNKIRIFE